MNTPTNLKYSEDHEWVRIEGDVAYIGISDFAQDQLGEIVFVEIETEGETMDAGEIFGSVEAVKTVSELILPVSCEILEFNEKLEDNPELVNDDPYGEGWMIKVAMKDAAELDQLMDAAAYEAYVS